GAGSCDVFLLKYDGTGNLTWAKTAGGASNDTASSVSQTGDGGYIVAGQTHSYGAGSCDVFLLKYDGTGNLTWAKTAGGTDADYGLSVKQTGDGGYIVVGFTESYGAGHEDVLLLKYDSSGALTWAKTAGGTGNEISWSMSQTSDGGYIVAGVTESYGAGNRDVLLMKADSNGDISGCAACASASPSVSTPTPSTSSPTPSTSTPTPSTSTPTPSTSTPSPATSVECSTTVSGLEDVLVVSKEANVGIGTKSPNSALQVTGYVQLDTVSAAPPAADCDEASEEGRMKVDPTSELLYICVSSGWVTK
ncbi:MAG: hypothetical protein GY849_20860, partial [Deltaproteobacteria bacterium]|nr:hypothetical protein [Deltaproteobacteria bacterium]